MSQNDLRTLAHSILANYARPPDVRQFATSVLAHLDEETRIGVELHEADRAVRRAKAAVSGPLPPLRGQVKLWNNLEAARAARALVVESAVALLLSRTAGSANPETPRQSFEDAPGRAEAPADVQVAVRGNAEPATAEPESGPQGTVTALADWVRRAPEKTRQTTMVELRSCDDLSRVTGWNAEYCQRWWMMNVGPADTVTFDAVSREIEIEEQADESAGEES